MPDDRIDPWASVTYDYERLIAEFGIERFDLDEFPLPSPQRLFRRGVVFGHRGFGTVHRAISRGESFAVLTGLAPSGRMHFGHKMVLDQVLAYHGWGADVYVAVADLEAWGARGIPIARSRGIAREEYLLNYIALGLPAERTQVYWQSERKDVEDLAFVLSRAVNWSSMRSVYGFGDETNMAHVQAPMVQMGDILHVQLDAWGGPRPTVVPVGVDQDPHIRVARDIARAFRAYSVQEVEAGKDGPTIPSGARTGIFLKGDRPEGYIDAIESALKEGGHCSGSNRPYRAVYSDLDANDADALALGIEHGQGEYGFFAPAATYHMLMTSLTGGKMSSSAPDSAIFLSDAPSEAVRKLKAALTGGRTTAEEQRRKGGEPERCAVYEMLRFHLLEDDAELERVRTECLRGERLCGGCKREAAQLLEGFMEDLHEKRDQARDSLGDFISG